MNNNDSPEGSDSSSRELASFGQAPEPLTMANPEIRDLYQQSTALSRGDNRNNADVRYDGSTIEFNTRSIYGDSFKLPTESKSTDESNRGLSVTEPVTEPVTGTVTAPEKQEIRKPDGTFSRVEADNSIVTKDATGIETVMSPDGIIKRTDSKGELLSLHKPIPSINGLFDRKSDGAGGFIDNHTGARPENNFTLIQDKNGNLEVTADSGDKSVFQNDDTLKAPRQKLIEQAEKNISDPALLSKFKADMVRLENRQLSSKEIEETYKQVGRLFEDKPGAIPKSGRTAIAEQVMSQAATPTSIDQGNHDTCTAATIEANIYTREPSRAAKLVADVAETGKFVATDGSTISVPSKNFRPDWEAKNNPPKDGERSFASQVFQTTALNTYYQTQNWFSRYEQDEANNKEQVHFSPLGLDYSSEGFAGLRTKETAKLLELLTGRNDKNVLAHEKRLGADDDSVVKFKSPQELAKRLSDLKQKGQLPAIISVHTGNEPFNHSAGSYHVVNITDFDAKNGIVKLDNQWGSQSDHLKQGISIETLYRATQGPTESIREEIARANPTSSAGENELKVLEKLSGNGKKIHTYELTLGLYEVQKDWHQKGLNPDPSNQARIDALVDKTFKDFNPKEKLDFLSFAPHLNRIIAPEKFNETFLKSAKESKVSADDLNKSLEAVTNPGLISSFSTLIFGKSTPGASDQLANTLAKLPEKQRQDIIEKLRRGR